MLTKKDYKAIAEIIKIYRPDESGNDYDNGRNHGVTDVAYSLANYFQQDNPRFNRQKFIEACRAD